MKTLMTLRRRELPENSIKCNAPVAVYVTSHQ